MLAVVLCKNMALLNELVIYALFPIFITLLYLLYIDIIIGNNLILFIMFTKLISLLRKNKPNKKNKKKKEKNKEIENE